MATQEQSMVKVGVYGLSDQGYNRQEGMIISKDKAEAEVSLASPGKRVRVTQLLCQLSLPWKILYSGDLL
jgi:hypothetical protein